jgi:uncharacterized protein YjiS (DUF1127 family)
MLARHFIPTPVEAHTSLVSQLVGFGTRAWSAWQRRREQKRTVHILSTLDGRTLKDIGVDPSEIESVVYGNPSERVRPYGKDWRIRYGM